MRRSFATSRRIAAVSKAALALCCAVCLAFAAGTATAQQYHNHTRYNEDWPPGAVGQAQLMRGGPLAGYYQPIEIRAPEGCDIWLAEAGAFQPPQPQPAKAGMLIGAVYRFKVTGIPLNLGAEVYPTIEVIDRLYPPQGKEWRHPIPIELTQRELERALAGQFVTRVIYLEDPNNALPLAENDETEQQVLDLAGEQDPLAMADELGRPMAILRIGSRLPDATGPDMAFLYGCPPLVRAPELIDLPHEGAPIVAPPREDLPGEEDRQGGAQSVITDVRELFPFQRSRHE